MRPSRVRIAGAHGSRASVGFPPSLWDSGSLSWARPGHLWRAKPRPGYIVQVRTGRPPAGTVVGWPLANLVRAASARASFLQAAELALGALAVRSIQARAAAQAH